METLINVENQTLSMQTTPKDFVEGSQQYIKFKFDLQDEWQNLTVFAQFKQNGVAYNTYLDNNNCVFLPSEIGQGFCTLTLYGTKGNTIATTNYLNLRIDKNILIENAESTEITESLYSQMIQRIIEIEQKVERIRTDLAIYGGITSKLYYYNYDGSELLHEETVMYGEDGTYAGTPERNPSVSTIYTFVGWSKNMNATIADVDALDDVFDDRNVYAAYSESVRTYTVTWKNVYEYHGEFNYSHEEVVREDENVPYGTMPVWGEDWVPSDYNNIESIGWNPTPSPITGDICYTAIYSYTVNFYNGSELLQTVNTNLDNSASYTGETPVKTDVADPSRYVFTGWNPRPVNIWSDTDCYAQFRML